MIFADLIVFLSNRATFIPLKLIFSIIYILVMAMVPAEIYGPHKPFCVFFIHVFSGTGMKNDKQLSPAELVSCQ